MGKLAIIGLGLIGGSMGLALKRAEPANTEVVGYDREPDVAARALKAGAVKSVAPTLERAVADASMIIIATPIITMRRIFEEIAPLVPQGSVVTDTASTKTDVMRWAREALPAGVHFVGGHPMAGKEQSGPAAAEAKLFDDRPYCIVPDVHASAGAVNAVVGLATALGAKPFFLDAQEHDAYAAGISHLPLAVSLALFNLVRGSTAWPELGGMAGPAFYDLTRLASGEPAMSHDIFLTNRDNVLHWIERFTVELQRLAEQIRTGDEETLFRGLAETQIEREKFLLSPPKREESKSGVSMPSPVDSFMTMMAGGLWAARAQDMTDDLEERARKHDHEERLHRRD